MSLEPEIITTADIDWANAVAIAAAAVVGTALGGTVMQLRMPAVDETPAERAAGDSAWELHADSVDARQVAVWRVAGRVASRRWLEQHGYRIAVADRLAYEASRGQYAALDAMRNKGLRFEVSAAEAKAAQMLDDTTTWDQVLTVAYALVQHRRLDYDAFMAAINGAD